MVLGRVGNMLYKKQLAADNISEGLQEHSTEQGRCLEAVTSESGFQSWGPLGKDERKGSLQQQESLKGRRWHAHCMGLLG